MNIAPRTRKFLVSVLAGLGITAGAASIANAVAGPSTTPPTVQAVTAASPTVTEVADTTAAADPAGVSDTADTAGTADANDTAGANDTADATGTADAADTAGTDASDTGKDSNTADPAYTASIIAPQGSGTESDENAALAPLAKISSADATKAALAAVPGTAGAAVLENENGNVVYGVTITTSTGSTDVKVDAGTGKVLAQDSGADNNDENG